MTCKYYYNCRVIFYYIYRTACSILIVSLHALLICGTPFRFLVQTFKYSANRHFLSSWLFFNFVLSPHFSLVKSSYSLSLPVTLLVEFLPCWGETIKKKKLLRKNVRNFMLISFSENLFNYRQIPNMIINNMIICRF